MSRIFGKICQNGPGGCLFARIAKTAAEWTGEEPIRKIG